MSEESKEERRRRNSEERKREEEYNRLKRLELIEKHKRSSYQEPVDKSTRKAEEKELIEQLRTERLASKDRRRQSIESNAESKKLPQFTVRRRSTVDESRAYYDESNPQPADATIYYPHQGVRRSIVSDIAKGGSRRATEPLKAQLLEIIGNLSPDSKFIEERRQSIKSGHTRRPTRDTIQETPDLVRSSNSSPTLDSNRPETSSPTTDSPRRLPPSLPVTAQYKREESEPIAGPSRLEDDLVASVSAYEPVMTTPTTPTKPYQEAKLPGPKLKCGTCPATSAPPHRHHESTDASTATDAVEEKQYDAHVEVSIATNTIKLPSTSSAMREQRTQEFINEGWYHNLHEHANDEFSSMLESSARQMKIPPHLQQQYTDNLQTMQSIQHMATSGPIICDRCRFGNDLVGQQSHPCCPAMAAQTMVQMDAADKQAVRTTAAIQCDNVCPTRNSILRTIYNAFKNPLGRPSYRRPTFDPTVSEFYRLNICEGRDYQDPPKRVIFDLIDGEMYRPTMTTVGTNTHIGIGNSPLIPQMGIVQSGGSNKLLFNPPPPPQQQFTFTDQQSSYNTGAIVVNHPQGDEPPKQPSKIAALKQNLRRHQERIDVYYFDHGNASYFRTTDSPGTIYTELIAERTEHNTAQYWAELFGTIHIAFSLFTAFFLQLYRFVLQSTFRPLIVGFVQLTSDYMIKPVLALLFNAIIQPILIYLYNIATSIRDLCEPIADALGFFLREIAVPIRAFRLVEVRQHTNTRPYVEM